MGAVNDQESGLKRVNAYEMTIVDVIITNKYINDLLYKHNESRPFKQKVPQLTSAESLIYTESFGSIKAKIFRQFSFQTYPEKRLWKCLFKKKASTADQSQPGNSENFRLLFLTGQSNLDPIMAKKKSFLNFFFSLHKSKRQLKNLLWRRLMSRDIFFHSAGSGGKSLTEEESIYWRNKRRLQVHGAAVAAAAEAQLCFVVFLQAGASARSASACTMKSNTPLRFGAAVLPKNMCWR